MKKVGWSDDESSSRIRAISSCACCIFISLHQGKTPGPEDHQRQGGRKVGAARFSGHLWLLISRVGVLWSRLTNRPLLYLFFPRNSELIERAESAQAPFVWRFPMMTAVLAACLFSCLALYEKRLIAVDVDHTTPSVPYEFLRPVITKIRVQYADTARHRPFWLALRIQWRRRDPWGVPDQPEQPQGSLPEEHRAGPLFLATEKKGNLKLLAQIRKRRDWIKKPGPPQWRICHRERRKICSTASHLCDSANRANTTNRNDRN